MARPALTTLGATIAGTTPPAVSQPTRYLLTIAMDAVKTRTLRCGVPARTTARVKSFRSRDFSPPIQSSAAAVTKFLVATVARTQIIISLGRFPVPLLKFPLFLL